MSRHQPSSHRRLPRRRNPTNERRRHFGSQLCFDRSMIFFAAAANVAVFLAVTVAGIAFCAPKKGKKENEPPSSTAGSSKVSSAEKNASSPADSTRNTQSPDTSNYTMPSYSGTLMIGAGATESPKNGKSPDPAKSPVPAKSPAKAGGPADGMSMAVGIPGEKRIQQRDGMCVDKDGRAISGYARGAPKR